MRIKSRAVNFDVFTHPEKYVVRLPLEKIVADSKVYLEGVEYYKQKIVNKEEVPLIIVIKHPNKELYAVLDGHHRYYAYFELGFTEIDCALAGDYSSVIFYLTKRGIFQPHSKITQHLRVPALQFHENLEQFLADFQKHPDPLKKIMEAYLKKINANKN
jgi:hypothetical protein